ncbi:MAG: alkyl hydroperoxide reductase [Bacteroidetes bacterium]|nr:MAG: alkyl hydroperoxide reductase [Bacteroidota bacterium]
MKAIYFLLLLANPLLQRGAELTQIHAISLLDLRGQTVSLHKYVGKGATVFIFISPECPLCQSYTLTINKLLTTYQTDSIRFLGIVPGQSFTTAETLGFKRKYKCNLTLLHDPNNKLTNLLKASITPEVFILNQQQKVIYQGRIDNWAYEVGRKRTVITEHNLRDAIEAFKKHQPITPPKTKAVGCFIE